MNSFVSMGREKRPNQGEFIVCMSGGVKLEVKFLFFSSHGMYNISTIFCLSLKSVICLSLKSVISLSLKSVICLSEI